MQKNRYRGVGIHEPLPDQKCGKLAPNLDTVTWHGITARANISVDGRKNLSTSGSIGGFSSFETGSTDSWMRRQR
jgi:hypothetical protein